MENDMMNKLTRYRFEAAVQDATQFSKEYLRQEYIEVKILIEIWPTFLIKNDPLAD